MRFVQASALVLLTSMGISGTIVFMDLEEVLPIAGSILIAEVTSSEEGSNDYTFYIEYTMNVIEVLRGSVDSGVPLSCVYGEDYPWSYTGPDGNEVWVSPLSTGSGEEFSFGPGDTVIVFMDAEHVPVEVTFSACRLESLDALGDVLALMAVSIPGGVMLYQTDAVLSVGDVCTYGFEFSEGSWRCLDLLERPAGTALRWEWSNEEQWQDHITDKSDTFDITMEVEDIRDIHYTCVIPDTPDRWMRLYVCRIMDIVQSEGTPE